MIQVTVTIATTEKDTLLALPAMHVQDAIVQSVGERVTWAHDCGLRFSPDVQYKQGWLLVGQVDDRPVMPLVESLTYKMDNIIKRHQALGIGLYIVDFRVEQLL